MATLSFQRWCFLFIAASVLAMTLRPVWIGWRLIGAPSRLHAAAPTTVPADGAPPTPAELDGARSMLAMITTRPVSEFPDEALAAAVDVTRKIRRERAAIARDQYNQRLGDALAQVPRGWILVGVGAVLEVLWGFLAIGLWRKRWSSDFPSTQTPPSA